MTNCIGEIMFTELAMYPGLIAVTIVLIWLACDPLERAAASRIVIHHATDKARFLSLKVRLHCSKRRFTASRSDAQGIDSFAALWISSIWLNKASQ